jgi:membrane peptidoglycan carboxypeptidase
VRRGRVLPAAVADDVSAAMKDVVDYGTGTAARQPFAVYGKTGTTDEARDAWFVGCVREPHYLCLATWMGYENHASMHDLEGVKGLIFGGTLPARVFARTFEILREIQARRAGLVQSHRPLPVPADQPTPASGAVRPRHRRPRPTATVTAVPKPSRSPLPIPQPSSSPPGGAQVPFR